MDTNSAALSAILKGLNAPTKTDKLIITEAFNKIDEVIKVVETLLSAMGVKWEWLSGDLDERLNALTDTLNNL